MLEKLSPFLSYTYWLSWSLIAGGFLVIGTVIAPVAFYIFPSLVSNTGQALEFSGALLTLIFKYYYPVCTVAIVIIGILEHLTIKENWGKSYKVVLFREALIFSSIGIWGYMAFILVPEMSTMVLDAEQWSLGTTRELFNTKHNLSNGLSQIVFIEALILPFFSHYSRLRKN